MKATPELAFLENVLPTAPVDETYRRQMIETLTKEPAGAAKSATRRPFHTAQK